MKASKMAFLTALSDIDPKYLKEFRRFLKPEPKWRIIMKKSMSFTAKAVTVAVAAVVLLGIAFLPGLFQNRVTPAAAPTEEQPLRICFDMGTDMDERGGTSEQELYVKSFINNYLLTVNIGVEEEKKLKKEQIEIEVIPSDESRATERATMLQRLRTEIMGGGGPDVFICVSDSLGGVYEGVESRLFPYVEFAIEDNLFLPLDDLMAEFEYTDPAKLTKVLLDAGKNKAGEQVVLPLRYTIPVLYYEPEDVKPVDQSGKTWDDVLTSDDPLLKEQARWAWRVWWGREDEKRLDSHDSELPCLFPTMLDTENRTLGFTEEELFALVQKSLPPFQSLLQEDSEIRNEAGYFKRYDAMSPLKRPQHSDDTGLTLIPMRNQTGGVTAMILSYGAVNANTAYPQYAAAFLDYISREGIQDDIKRVGGSTLVFGTSEHHLNGISINEDARRPNDSTYSQATSDEWEKATRQIDTVHFPSAVDTMLDEMTFEIGVALRDSVDPDFEWPPVWPEHYANGTISEEKLREIVHEAYKKMVELVGEA